MLESFSQELEGPGKTSSLAASFAVGRQKENVPGRSYQCCRSPHQCSTAKLSAGERRRSMVQTGYFVSFATVNERTGSAIETTLG